jgi:V/A-type H+/Na+-transporting ATPase subunit G/H
MVMNTLDEVNKIEQAARDLEASYQEKITDILKQTEQKISEMKEQIDLNIKDYQEEQLVLKNKKISESAQLLEDQEEKEIVYLKQQYLSKKEQLVDRVIEEVMKQYGNS